MKTVKEVRDDIKARLVEIVDAANAATVERVSSVLAHPGDAQVFADAVSANAEYFATLDREHFLGNPKLKSLTKIRIGTPGDFLAWFRKRVGVQSP